MLPNESFQKLLYDLFCTWHGVRRHYDPPLTDTEEQKIIKVKNTICKLLSEIDGRVQRIKTRNSSEAKEQDFYEEWTMLTWNVLCITSRLQNSMSAESLAASVDDRLIYSRLNQALIQLVNFSRDNVPCLGVMEDEDYRMLKEMLDFSMACLHNLYKCLASSDSIGGELLDTFRMQLSEFAEKTLGPCIERFKMYCNANCERLWFAVREAQTERMRSLKPLHDEPINLLVSFYSGMMYNLAVLAARLQGFRYELAMKSKLFGSLDPVLPLSQTVYSALELLMSDCVLSTEPSTNAILVTNNLFSMSCGALARGVVFKDFDVQVVSEETAEQIQAQLRSQRLLQQPMALANVPSAALLAMKPASGTKRANSSNNDRFTDSPNNTSHKKSDVNSKESVTIYPVYNAKNRYWLATYPHLLCTTRQKGRHSTNNSYQDLSSEKLDGRSAGKRPLFYFHITATLFSPSGRFATAHTLSVPFTIATRRNQDCQVQRMMSSYTATIFWLYGSNERDGMLLQWIDAGMRWEQFKELYKQHFSVNAEVHRPLIDQDFDLLQYKLQCRDCSTGEPSARINGAQQIVTFRNVLCPHLRYECGTVNVRFSVWRGMLELLQIFHDTRNNVRMLWEKNLLYGFLEFDQTRYIQVDQLLEKHHSTLIMRLSFVTGGTICFTVKSFAHSMGDVSTMPMHLEPLDLKKLQAKCLFDYLRDISYAEKVKYILNARNELVRISDLLGELGVEGAKEDVDRHISSNVTHSGDIDAMQHIRFTAMRIAVVTCKVKPPSADVMEGEERLLASLPPRLSSSSIYDDFTRELIQLANFHNKSRADLFETIDNLSDHLFTTSSGSSTSSYHNYHSVVSSHQSPSGLPSPSIGYGGGTYDNNAFSKYEFS